MPNRPFQQNGPRYSRRPQVQNRPRPQARSVPGFPFFGSS